MITHQNFLDKWLGKRYRETPELWFQCVAESKLYYDEVYWITGLSFWGSALNGWNKKGNLQDILDIVTIPQVGDMCFFNKTPTNPSGHVWIYQDQKTLLEQNGGNWNWDGLWSNAIRLWKMPKNILGYMRPRESENDKKVKYIVSKLGLQTPSKSQSYSEYDMCLILYALDKSK